MASLRCHPSGFVKGAVEYISLEFRREVEDGDKSRQCQHNGIKLRVEEIA